ncbi:hypothetical protein ACEQ8H_007954 [Pleosporales sp. CAS-2024a]
MASSDPSRTENPASRVDILRAQELFKYFRPPAKDGGDPDPILTAHAQLVAWRLDAQRSMISLIDEETQYFVAESTKTLHLHNPKEHEHPDDAIWAGCVRVSKSGRLCEHTIAAEPPQNGGPACFEVLDLNKDARFNQLDFVTGPPYFKHYAGVPLRTRLGVNIGSIFVIDSRIRPALTKTEWDFLTVTANNVMHHLEMSKDTRDCAQSLRMSACMSAFVNKSRRGTREETLHHDNGYLTRHQTSSETSVDLNGATDASRFSTYARAATYLLEGLDLEGDGCGVMFLDTLPAKKRAHDQDADGSAMTYSNQTSGIEKQDATNPFVPRDSRGFGSFSRKVSSGGPTLRCPEMLAHASSSSSSQKTNTTSTTFSTCFTGSLSLDDLCELIESYPDGNLFTFDTQSDALTSSVDDLPTLVSSSKGLRLQSEKWARRELQQHFPKARQIIFLPMWDAPSACWTICIVYHGSKYRQLSKGYDFLSCATFGNTIIAELAILANTQAAQQKNDFIASISHELRSPLHGVLASCEFLADTTLSDFQKSLVNSSEACARTLLDTINMVLDYSDINKFERQAGQIEKRSWDLLDESHPNRLQASLSTQRVVDVAALVEEVVGSVVAGHSFEARHSRVGSDMGDGLRSIPVRAYVKDEESNDFHIDIILDIAAHDWTLLVEPGAVRRIVMNLVGNALKFTNAGFVHIKLDMANSHSSAGVSSFELTVTDSGTGISPDYLKNKLFSPFSQESHITSGFGLGLTLVESIVRAMGGKISVESTPGVGTRAIVELPLARQARAKVSVMKETSRSPFDNAAERDRNMAIATVRKKAMERSGALYWPKCANASSSQDRALHLLQKSVATYLSRWFGLSISPWQKSCMYDVVITTFVGLQALKKLDPNLFTGSSCCSILAIATSASPLPSAANHAGCEGVVVLGQGFGPCSMAQALRRCLDISAQREMQGGGPEIQEEASMASSERGTSISKNPSYEQQQAVGSLVDHEQKEPSSRAQVVSSGAYPASDAPSALPVEVPHKGKPEMDATVSKAVEPANKTGDAVLDTASVAGAKSSNVELTMLLVDDNAINLRLLQMYSKKLGHAQAHSAENGQLAVETYERLLHSTPPSPPDIILMDISMPVMNGFEATRQIRKIEASYNRKLSQAESRTRSFIIALTGLASVKDQEQAFAAGIDRYMMKPASFAKLSVLLEKWRSDRLNEVG